MSETNSSPNLTVVEGGPDEKASDLQKAQTAPPSRRLRSWLTWLLLVLAIGFCWAWLSEVERAQGLEGRVTVLTVEIADARADLAAWERHMDAVRGEVDGVARALGSLQALVVARPGEPAAESPAGSAAAEPSAEVRAAP